MTVHSQIKTPRRFTRLTSPLASRRARDLLAAANDMTPRSSLRLARADQPEVPMSIRFEGISLAEQRAALAAFPGGKRFVLEA